MSSVSTNVHTVGPIVGPTHVPTTSSTYLEAVGFKSRDQFARTPPGIYAQLDAEFHFDFDPCPVAPTFDGLAVDWRRSNYVNPPYNDIASWVRKAVDELQRGNTSVFLIPFRPHTLYYKEFVHPYASEIRFFSKSVRFQGYKRVAPFAVVVVVYRPHVVQVRSNFAIYDIRAEARSYKVEALVDALRRRDPHLAPTTSSGGYDFDNVVLDAPRDYHTAEWGHINFVCARYATLAMMQRAHVEQDAGHTTVLIVPLRTEIVGFATKVLRCAAKMVRPIFPAFICEGFKKASPIPTLMLVYGPMEPLSVLAPAFHVVEPWPDSVVDTKTAE